MKFRQQHQHFINIKSQNLLVINSYIAFWWQKILVIDYGQIRSFCHRWNVDEISDTGHQKGQIRQRYFKITELTHWIEPCQGACHL